jgi:hypothetical protein
MTSYLLPKCLQNTFFTNSEYHGCACVCTSYSSRSLVVQLKHDFNAIAARLENDYSTTLTSLHEKINWISTTHIRLREVWLLHWERRTKKRLIQYYRSIRNDSHSTPFRRGSRNESNKQLTYDWDWKAQKSFPYCINSI